MESATIINELIEYTKEHLNRVQVFKEMPLEQLNHRNQPESWSILECLEHLNLYGDFYLPEIKRRIAASRHQNNRQFKSGRLGNYFVNLIKPKENLNKMKTGKSVNPIGSTLDAQVIDKFIQQQEQMLVLLNDARRVNLSKTKTSISLTKLVKLRLGDTLRFVIYHNERHILQAEKVLEGVIVI
ncbi:hypothetical protein BKI52_45210 [marine bacterium AO1-C]|nr:hypothetical protein BKI52_45210 [marine bacterium AO1-C]